MRRARLPEIAAVGWLVLAACGLGCGTGGAGSERPNVLLVTLDTTRADHLGCYGYERDTSAQPRPPGGLGAGLRARPLDLELDAAGARLALHRQVHRQPRGTLRPGGPVAPHQRHRRTERMGALPRARIAPGETTLAESSRAAGLRHGSGRRRAVDEARLRPRPGLRALRRRAGATVVGPAGGRGHGRGAAAGSTAWTRGARSSCSSTTTTRTSPSAPPSRTRSTSWSPSAAANAPSATRAAGSTSTTPRSATPTPPSASSSRRSSSAGSSRTRWRSSRRTTASSSASRAAGATASR